MTAVAGKYVTVYACLRCDTYGAGRPCWCCGQDDRLITRWPAMVCAQRVVEPPE